MIKYMAEWPMDKPEIRTVVTTLSAPESKILLNSFIMPKVFYGLAGLQMFSGSMPQFGRKRAFIITDKGVKDLAITTQKILKVFGLETKIYDNVEPEVPLGSIKPVAEKMEEFQPDLIVAVGGGSVIDMAKASWILYEEPKTDLTNVDAMRPLGLRKKALIACIPTTAGTGSEATNVAVITDDSVEPHRKEGVVHPELYPDFAVLDPKFVVRMPQKLTLGTGLDALSHAVDCYLCRSSNEISDALAVRATKMIFNYLPLALRYPENLQIRLKTQIAAMIAGAAFSNGGIGTTHAVAHNIGALFKVHHGMACGVTIPYIIKFYAEVDDKYIYFAKELGIDGQEPDEILKNLVNFFVEFYRKIGAPLTMKELGISEQEFKDKLDIFAKYVVMDPTGPFAPRQFTVDEAKELLVDIYYGRLKL
ncbi:MAG: iron-containing alcohol dehydrogenase [Archaeoglobaceae archaeon]